MSRYAIDGRTVAPDQPPYIIAEMSGNHNGDIDRAFALMDAATAAGADAVKLQTYTADTLTIDHDAPEFLIEGGPWDGRRLYELYQEASTPWEWHEALFARGRELGITVFSSPFDRTAIAFLETLGCPAYKIASFEAVDLPLIAAAAETGKPLIISTGMIDHDEIAEALATVKRAGNDQVALLHCVSAYPAPAEEANLRTIADIAADFGVPAGLSDHTMGIAVPVAAVAMGAQLIEKHFTLARGDGGPDAAFSLEPDELGALVDGCRTAWSALGGVTYERTDAARGSLVFRRSLYVVEDIAAGAVFTETNLRSIRPGHGLAPKYLPGILGQRAPVALKRGTALAADMVEGFRTDD